ncbi:MAG: hypothetical protein PWP23_825 [Candidatus Sumerlaeota bacterium]|nr:hypothetical protein [Candidatus Sumerlaeota bacterium]
MTGSMTPMRRKNSRLLVIELRPGWVRATECHAGNTTDAPLRSVMGELSCDPFGGDPETAGAEIRLLLEQGGLRPGAAIVTVPMAWTMTHAFEAPELSAEDFASLLELEAEKAFPYPPEDMVLSQTRCTRADAPDIAIAAAMPTAKLDALEAVLRAAHIAPLAIVPACVHAHGEAANGVSLIAEGHDLVLCIASDGGLLALRVLCKMEPGAGIEDEALRADILRELRVALRTLPEELAEARTTVAVHAPLELAARLAEQLGPQAGRMGISVKAVPSPPDEIARRLSAAAFEGQALTVNFLRPRITRWQRHLASMRRKGFVVRAAIVGASLLAIAVLVFAAHTWRARYLDAKWLAMRDGVASVESYEKDIRAWRPWNDASAPSLDLLKSITEAFPVSGEVTASTLHIKDQTTVTCTGTATSASSFSRFQEALGARPGVSNLKVQQMRGDSPVQFSLSFTWNPRGKT